ncbi:MAG TPA: uroporphyrinogen-III C-methyltransferase [Syntrophorhabdales bacterium]|nr:uroporphyrinogen-III C-methyltransferase [Syntrophorhabdales bacterium]
MTTTKGKVYLVGAGPGDIGLITVKGLRILERAEVVVYDFHLNPQILNYIRQSAEFIYAGKRGGHHTMTQNEINRILVEKARQGRMVCRLKGGDPFVFGRGGEEAEMLARERIAFEIVPGVSSVVAAPAYAGIPLTHRDYSSSFSVITGNEAVTKGEESGTDWGAISKGHETLVFLMGVKNIEMIVQRLIDHGKSPATPAAVIRWGTRPDQKTVVGTLGNIVDLIHNEQIRPPAVMVVGNVVRLRRTLQWYEMKPLFGHRILITREYSADYEPLEDLGGEVFEFPTVRTVEPENYDELDRAIRIIASYEWLIFDSVRGFTFFLKRFLEIGCDIRDLKGIRLCALGARTAEEIERSGMRPDLVSERFHGEELVHAFRTRAAEKKTELGGTRLLLPCAENVEEPVAGYFRRAGCIIDTPAAYRTIKRERHGKRLTRFLTEGRISIAAFTSGEAFTNFLEIVGSDILPVLKKVAIAAIDSSTQETIEKAGLAVDIIPAQATTTALVAEIIRWAEKKRSTN